MEPCAESHSTAAAGLAALAAGCDTALDEAAIAASEQDAKIGLLATVDPAGLPHLTLITSLQARGPRGLMFGQFTEGESKKHVKDNPRTGFLLMSPKQDIWRGKARWKGEAKSGTDYELYNHKPMFRYNAYFGIHTVHYLDIVELQAKRRVSVPSLLVGAAATAVVKSLSTRTSGPPSERVLTPWAASHVSRTKTLKFLGRVGDDGYPCISLPLACRVVDGRRLLFSPAAGRHELDDLREGEIVALHALNLQMESVLVRGRFTGYRSHGGVRTGNVEIEWVYNSMPPKQGRIYPPEPLRARF
jgi:hypothetical protein